MTLLKPARPMARRTAEYTLSIINDKEVPRLVEIDVQVTILNCYQFDPIVVDGDNIDVLGVLIK